LKTLTCSMSPGCCQGSGGQPRELQEQEIAIPTALRRVTWRRYQQDAGVLATLSCVPSGAVIGSTL